jgi:hypothetical protein
MIDRLVVLKVSLLSFPGWGSSSGAHRNLWEKRWGPNGVAPWMIFSGLIMVVKCVLVTMACGCIIIACLGKSKLTCPAWARRGAWSSDTPPTAGSEETPPCYEMERTRHSLVVVRCRLDSSPAAAAAAAHPFRMTRPFLNYTSLLSMCETGVLFNGARWASPPWEKNVDLIEFWFESYSLRVKW